MILSIFDDLVCCHAIMPQIIATTCIKSTVRNLQRMQHVCSSQPTASLQFATCRKSTVRNLQRMHHVCSSQPAASLQFATCSKSADRKLHQVCSSQLAASLLTTCSRLDIIKSEQAMRTHIIKSEQAMRTHPDIGLMIASCKKPAADLLQLARF